EDSCPRAVTSIALGRGAALRSPKRESLRHNLWQWGLAFAQPLQFQKFQEPQRIRFFIWLALKQRLLTNVERVRRGIGHDTTCGVCGHGFKDILYVIMDGSATRSIWDRLIPIDRQT
ncbi:hypothetical protein Godav_022866, partial [Gossypium davidsonii]|nr:hypothetical protein [Gossypium davidsonii]